MSDAISENTKQQLLQLISKIERLEEEKKNLSQDLAEVYSEAKANGFDIKIVRQVVRLRKIDAGKRQEQEELLDLYMHAVGMV